MNRYASAAAAAFVLLGSSAIAPASAAAFDGFYFGVQVGDTWGDVSQPYGDVGGPFDSTQNGFKGSALNAGGHIGYDFLLDQFVIGAVADYNFINFEGDDAGSGGDVNGLKIDSVITARIRAGYLVLPRSLVYATAGEAWMSGGASAPTETPSADFSGYTFGLGASFAIGDDATFGVEWRRFEFDRERVSFPVNDYDEGIKPNIDTIQVSLSYYLSGLVN